MNQTKNFIDRDSTNIIKGIALIFMYIHHFFTFPDWYIEGISYPYLESFASFFCQPFRICVPMFAFLTGYFYFFNQNKNYLYSLRKCTDFWINYFVTFLLLLILAVVLGQYDFSVVNFISESLGFYKPTMVFCWYVMFYFATMLLLPIYSKLSDKSTVLAFFLTLIIPQILILITNEINVRGIGIISKLSNNLIWFPCVAIGYCFAKQELFFSFSDLINIESIFIKTLLYIFFMVIPFLVRNVDEAYDFVYVALFIYGLVNIINMFQDKRIFFPISLIGKYSLTMWFIHCVFFNTCKEYTQWILYLPKNPILVLIWGLLICFSVSYIITIPISYFIKIKNILIKKLWREGC